MRTDRVGSLPILLKQLRHHPRGWRKVPWVATIVVLVAAIGALHHFSGHQLNFFVLFLAPTIIATWMLCLSSGIAIALISAGIGFYSDLIHFPDADTLIPLVNAITRFSAFSFVAWSVWEIRNLSRAVANLALTDPLTGLNNRRAFMLRGLEELERAKRYEQPLSIMYIDLDNFKAVNDTLGHDEGDRLLEIVARIIRARLRNTDFEARMGGDEFAAILPATGSNGGRELAEALRDNLNTALAAQAYPVTASIGVATYLHPPATFGEALKQADALMYEVKNLSKNAVLQRDFTV